MAEQGPYFGDSATISMELEGGTNIPVGNLQSIEIRVVATRNEYFSADSAKRQDVKHTERVPVISATIGSWDPLLFQHYLGGSGKVSNSIEDTSDPQKYTINGSVTPSGGSTKYEAQVVGAETDDMPMFTASRNEFVGLEVEFRGDDLTIITAP